MNLKLKAYYIAVLGILTNIIMNMMKTGRMFPVEEFFLEDILYLIKGDKNERR